MTWHKFKNYAETRLLTEIDDDDTTVVITLADTGKFPSNAECPFWAVFQKFVDTVPVFEIIAVTAVSSNTWTVLRAQDGSSASSFPSGSKIEQTMVAGAIDEIQTSINTYIHNQGVPAAVWAITHNLGRYPHVSVVTSAEDVVIGDVNYTSINELTVTFIAGFAGKAYLN
jgi:hypothetical protein